jgi:flagellar biosynthesis protein FlhA
MAGRAREMGYTVVDSISILGTHLSETVRRYAHELFTRKDAKKLLDRVSEDNQRLVEDLVPKLVSAGTFQKVIQNLLRERVSIRDASSILEAMTEAAQITRNPALISEYVRQSMKRTVVHPYLNAAGEIQAFLLDPQIEQAVESAAEHGEHASHLNLPPQKVREVIDRVQRGLSQPEGPATLITTSGARYFLRQILEAPLPHITVLSHGEIPPGVKVAALGTIR